MNHQMQIVRTFQKEGGGEREEEEKGGGGRVCMHTAISYQGRHSITVNQRAGLVNLQIQIVGPCFLIKDTSKTMHIT